MPRTRLGQLITFAIELDTNQSYNSFVWITARKGDTIRKICGRKGHPEMARQVCQLNGIRNPMSVLHPGKRIKLPGTLKKGESVSILADDPAPTMKDGYAQYDVIPRPGREGISRFLGYNPIAFDIPVQWEAYTAAKRDLFAGNGETTGQQVEADIELLERMAGRGNFPGAPATSPAVIRISCTDNNGNIVLLLPANYQWTPGNPSPPLWRISNITWGGNPLRLPSGRRVRQTAVVEVTKYTPISVVTRSATERSKQRNSPSWTDAWQKPRAGADTQTTTVHG